MSEFSQSQIIQEIVNGLALSMSAAGKIVPALRGESSTRPETIWRWCRHGHKLRDGTTIKLECARLAGRWLTSKPALARFLERVTAASSPESTDPTSLAPTPHSAASGKRCEAAVRKLTSLGA